ncbi:MAG: metal ABC transporter permease [Alphaproteobacteria bacterium]|nr:metal ABC transporter permease [Alphaproteobacteria bacterium]
MLELDFMRSAFMAAAAVALIAGPVGYFLVLRGQTFAGHALAHVGFTGATGAVLLGLPPLAGLMALTVVAGLGMGLFGARLANRDIAIGMVLALSLGFGLLFLHYFKSSATQASALLFGNILAITAQTLSVLVVISALCLALLLAISRPLLLASLQPDLAEAKGVSLAGLSTLFMVVVALATAATSQIVGVLLVFALMVGPGATALRLSTSVMAGLFVAAGLALVEAWAGLALAYFTDWPVSFWITALAVAFYATSAVLARRPGHG